MTNYVSISSLARLLDVHRCTIYRMVASGALPKPTYLGVTPRFNMASVELHLERLSRKRRPRNHYATTLERRLGGTCRSHGGAVVFGLVWQESGDQAES